MEFPHYLPAFLGPELPGGTAPKIEPPTTAVLQARSSTAELHAYSTSAELHSYPTEATLKGG